MPKYPRKIHPHASIIDARGMVPIYEWSPGWPHHPPEHGSAFELTVHNEADERRMMPVRPHQRAT